MLFNGFDKPLHLQRKPSTRLAVYLLMTHALVLLALTAPLALPIFLYILCWLLCGASALYHGFYYWPRSYDQQQYWVWQKNGDWVYNSDNSHTVMQLHNAIVTPWFILVTLGAGRNARHGIYVADQLDADTWRRLRVRLAGFQANDTWRSSGRR